MRIDTIEIRLLDTDQTDGKIAHTIRYAAGTWSVDGVIYPRYLTLMDTISKFMSDERRHDRERDKGKDKDE